MPPDAWASRTPRLRPYGVFKTKDGADILISVQSDREWRVLAQEVLEDKALADRSAFRDQCGAR